MDLVTNAEALSTQTISKVMGLDEADRSAAVRGLQNLTAPFAAAANVTITEENWAQELTDLVRDTVTSDLFGEFPTNASEGDVLERTAALYSALNLVSSLRRFIADDIPYTQIPQVTSSQAYETLAELLKSDPKGYLAAVATDAARLNATDILLGVGSPPRFSVPGGLVELNAAPLTREDMERLFLDNILSKRQGDRLESDEKRSVDTAITLDAVPDFRFRANVYHRLEELACVMRLIPTQVPTIESLGLPQSLRDLVNIDQGLIIFTGPTGSGKTSSLASLIDHINTTRQLHIVTIEDPIEYVHRSRKSHISQRQVGTDTPSYADGFKDALRQLPKVILIGEIRSMDELNAAISAANTGHIVFSTLHTNTAPETVDRMIKILGAKGDGEKSLRQGLANALRGIIAQKLVPNVDNTGRVCAVEIMVNTPTVANLIAEGNINDIERFMQEGAHYNMCTLQTALLEHLSAGRITEETAMRAATNVSAMKQAIHAGKR